MAGDLFPVQLTQACRRTYAKTVKEQDPYRLDPSAIREPPTTWAGSLPYLGPGFILSASIVGSGELIATTALGAEIGFIGLWIILLSCTIKVALQLQFGRYVILTGKTVMDSFNRLPGPSIRGVNWSIWLWLAAQPFKILQVGGIVGGLAILLAQVLPALSVSAWSWISATIVALLVSINRYRFVERTCLVLLSIFTLLTITSVIALQWTGFALSMPDLLSGLQFDLPTGAIVVVFGTFGLTGVGGDEIMQYPYWMLEKGYARYAGPPNSDDPEWQRRARGWIHVMYLDALLSMVAYTIVTIAFYLLGAAVLHSQGLTPKGHELITVLASMYTDSLGDWAKSVFLAGAFVVLFSTLFSALAAWTRTYTDAFAKLGWCDFEDARSRERMIKLLAWVFPFLWAALFLVYNAPVAMVVLGGVATTAILLLVVYAAVVFRISEPAPALRPTLAFDVALAVSCVSIAAFAVYVLL